MKTRVLMTLLMGLSLTGCNQFLVGQWNLEATNPAAAQGRYEVQTVTFNPDARTFAAMIQNEGKTSTSAGQYSFNGFQLTLQPKEGPRLVYSAYIDSFTKKLHTSGTLPAAEGRPAQRVSRRYGRVRP